MSVCLGGWRNQLGHTQTKPLLRPEKGNSIQTHFRLSSSTFLSPSGGQFKPSGLDHTQITEYQERNCATIVASLLMELASATLEVPRLGTWDRSPAGADARPEAHPYERPKSESNLIYDPHQTKLKGSRLRRQDIAAPFMPSDFTSLSIFWESNSERRACLQCGILRY